MTNDIEAAARAYLAAYDVESSNSEMWYRAVVDARDALRAALAEATEPATKPEGCPTCGETDPLVVLQMDRRERKTESMLVRCHDRFHDTHPPTPAEGRGEEDGSRGCIVRFCDDHAEVEIVPGPFCPVCSMALVLRDGVKLGRDARSIQHGDGGGNGAPLADAGAGGDVETWTGEAPTCPRCHSHSRHGAINRHGCSFRGDYHPWHDAGKEEL